MRDTFNKIGFDYVCNVNNFLKERNNNLSLLNNYEGQKGIFVFVENNEIIYVGRTDSLKKRIGQCVRDEKDTGSIKFAQKLDEDQYERILNSDIYIMIICENELKNNISFYSIFK